MTTELKEQQKQEALELETEIIEVKARLKQLYIRENALKRNAENYLDPTAYAAIKKAEGSERDNEFYEILHQIFDICKAHNFRLIGRINFIDKVTGKKYY